jgi:hypothetical protein
VASLTPYRPPGGRGGGLSTTGRATIQIDRKSHVEIDVGRALDALGAHVVGTIKIRTQQGKDLTGAGFQEYTEDYRNALRRGKELGNVDLRVTGSMISSLDVVGRGARLGVRYVTVGFDATYGPKYHLAGGQIKRTGQRNITNGALARVHHLGLGRVPRRRFFGLSKMERQAASRHAMSVGIVRQQAGPPRRGA